MCDEREMIGQREDLRFGLVAFQSMTSSGRAAIRALTHVVEVHHLQGGSHSQWKWEIVAYVRVREG
jgi:hypothetical protein